MAGPEGIMKKVYLIRLEGGGDVEERWIDEEAWNWITSDDKGQRPEDIGESMWTDQNVPESILQALEDEHKKYGYPGARNPREVQITSGSWDNDRALTCPSNVSLDLSKLDYGALRDSLAEQGFEYTGEVYEGAIY